MSNEKINLQQFKLQLVTKSGLSAAQVNEFVEAFQEAFKLAMEQDKLLKVAGLGTFKLVWVEERKSVNVQTKSEFVIPGHYKVAFTPDSKMLEVVNAPYSHLEPIELTNEGEVDDYELPLQKLNEQAIELKGILADIQDLEPEPVKKHDNKATKSDVKAAELVEKQQPLEEPAIKSEPLIATSSDIVAPEEENSTAETIEISIPGVDATTTIEVKPKRSYRGLVTFIVILLVLAAVGVVGYFFKDTIYDYYNRFVQKVEEASTNTTDAVKMETPSIPADSLNTDSIAQDTIPAAKLTAAQSIFDQPRTYTEFIGKETFLNGSRLTMISYKYYGEKSFWVYIYEANKDVIEDPDRVAVGTIVRIPKLPAYLINSKDSACMAYAKKLHDIYVFK